MPFKRMKKKVFVSHYQDAKVRNGETAVRLMVKNQLEANWQPWDGPILITDLILSFPLTSSMRASERKAALSGVMIPKYTAPDVTDNLMKGIFDAMQGLVYTNDSRIIGIQNSLKCYWKRPGTFLKMAFFEDLSECIEYYEKDKLTVS